MWDAIAELRCQVDPMDVWALWEDPARWKDWNEQIVHAELRGPFAVGSRASIRFRRRPLPLSFTITALEPGVRFTDETRLPGATLGHEHILRVDGELTMIRHRLYLRGPAAKLYALLMGRQMRSAVSDFVVRERNLAQRA